MQGGWVTPSTCKMLAWRRIYLVDGGKEVALHGQRQALEQRGGVDARRAQPRVLSLPHHPLAQLFAHAVPLWTDEASEKSRNRSSAARRTRKKAMMVSSDSR